MAKSTKTTVTKRVEEVLQLRLAGASFLEILQYATENKWGVQQRQLWEYIKKSDELLKDTIEQDRPKLLALHLAQRRLLLNRSMEMGDYRTALAVLRDSAELQGLYDYKLTLEHRGSIGQALTAEDLSDDQLAAIIAAKSQQPKPERRPRPRAKPKRRRGKSQ